MPDERTLHSEARDDLTAILEYISRDNPRAAQQVVNAIERATDRLSQFPLVSLGRGGNPQACHPRLPFIAVYGIASDTDEIIAVFHAAQDRPWGQR